MFQYLKQSEAELIKQRELLIQQLECKYLLRVNRLHIQKLLITQTIRAQYEFLLNAIRPLDNQFNNVNNNSIIAVRATIQSIPSQNTILLETNNNNTGISPDIKRPDKESNNISLVAEIKCKDEESNNHERLI
eukprot:UN07065